jgi:hypothetical protein
MLVLLGSVVLSLAQSQRNRKQRKALRARVVSLDKRVGRSSGDLALDLKVRTGKLETRMSTWRKDAQKELDEKLVGIQAWNRTHEARHRKLDKDLKESRKSRLGRAEMETAMGRLEKKLVAGQDKAVNLLKSAVIQLQRTVDEQGVARESTRKKVVALKSNALGLSDKVEALSSAIAKLGAAQVKENQAAGAQRARLTVEVTQLGAQLGREVAALKKALAEQAKQIEELSKREK